MVTTVFHYIEVNTELCVGYVISYVSTIPSWQDENFIGEKKHLDHPGKTLKGVFKMSNHLSEQGRVSYWRLLRTVLQVSWPYMKSYRLLEFKNSLNQLKHSYTEM